MMFKRKCQTPGSYCHKNGGIIKNSLTLHVRCVKINECVVSAPGKKQSIRSHLTAIGLVSVHIFHRGCFRDILCHYAAGDGFGEWD